MAKKITPWIALVKKQYNIIKAEGKLKGMEMMKEAIKRAKKVYVKVKNK